MFSVRCCDIFIEYFTFFFIVCTVDCGIAMIAIAGGDRLVRERNVQCSVYGLQGTLVYVVGYAHLGCITAQILYAAVCLLTYSH